jgi:hypothetical protein
MPVALVKARFHLVLPTLLLVNIFVKAFDEKVPDVLCGRCCWEIITLTQRKKQ